MFCCYCSRKIGKRLERIEAKLRFIGFMVSPPRSVSLVTIGEIGMAIKFAVKLPAPPEVKADWDEIASGRLVVIIDDGEGIVIDTTKEQQSGDRLLVDPRFIGPQGVEVVMSFAYIDNAGNIGPSIEAQQELKDTVPPVAPTAIGLQETEEVPDEEPTVSPDPA